MKSRQSGQVLLVTVMLLATALVVALSVSFTSTTETQITKLEEESQKALAAAEAAIEAALEQGGNVGFGSGSLSDFSGYVGGAQIETSYNQRTFVSPLLQPDEQYTFYLSDYPNLNNYWNGFLTIYFKSQTGCPALELTFIDNNNNISKNLIDPCNKISKPTSDIAATNTGAPYNIDGISFDYKTASGIAVSNKKLVLVRVLSTSTKVGFESNAVLKPQGKFVTSTAQSQTGVTKKVTLFQSYPQIPAEFFVTSF